MRAFGTYGVAPAKTPFNWNPKPGTKGYPYELLPHSEQAGHGIISTSSRLETASMGSEDPVLSAKGIITYGDVFGEDHLTEFCYRGIFPYVDWAHWPIGKPIIPFRINCPDHNCEDDECGPGWRARAEAMK